MPSVAEQHSVSEKQVCNLLDPVIDNSSIKFQQKLVIFLSYFRCEMFYIMLNLSWTVVLECGGSNISEDVNYDLDVKNALSLENSYSKMTIIVPKIKISSIIILLIFYKLFGTHFKMHV